MATITDTRSAGSIVNGLGGRTTIVNIAKTNITSAELGTILTDMQFDGFAVAGVATADGSAFSTGVTDNVQIALQSTAEYSAEGSNAHGVTGAVTTVLSIFKDK